jgi:hypothetical protein
MASAALNFGHERGRSIACHELRKVALTVGGGESPLPVHPEFMRAASNGELAWFIEKVLKDERYPKCGTRHTVTMLESLDCHQAALAGYAQQLRHKAGGERRGSTLDR